MLPPLAAIRWHPSEVSHEPLIKRAAGAEEAEEGADPGTGQSEAREASTDQRQQS